MVMSIRLDPSLQALIRRLARRDGRTASDIVREALLRLAAAESAAAEKSTRPYDRVEHLLGRVHGGPPDLSERTGRRFSQRLRESKGRRR